MTAGTGGGTSAKDSETGEELFANPYTIGSFPGTPNPQVYVFQDGNNVTEWWTRGNIDIVIQVKKAGAQINFQYITVFARQQGDTFTNYEIQLTAAGQNAVPLETSVDILDTNADHFIFYDNEATGPFTANTIIYHPTAGTVQWSAEIVSVTDWGTEGCLGIRGFKDPADVIADNDAFGNGTTTADINGSATGVLGTAWLAYVSQTGAFTAGEVLTGTVTTAKRRIIADQDDGITGKLLLDLNTGIVGADRNDYYRDFDDTEAITDPVTGAAVVSGTMYNSNAALSDITIAFINGTVTHSGTIGTFIPGERVTYNGGASEAIVVYDSGSALTLANVTDTYLDTETITGDISSATCDATQDFQIAHTHDFNFTQQPAYPYSVFVECGAIYEAGRLLSDIYPYLKYVCQEDSQYPMYKLRQVLEYAYSYESAGSVWTNESTAALDDTANDMNLLASADSTNDAYYFGADEEFLGAYINIGTAGVGTYTVTWEYWNGAWVALGNVDDTTTGFTAGTGWYWVRWDLPSDWATYNNGGSTGTAYWVRARISAWTAITTPPKGTRARTLTCLDPEDGEEYRRAFDGYAENRASPFGQKLGATFFGAQGVWLQGLDGTDANNISFSDANGVQRTPYKSITVKMTALVSGVTVLIARASAGKTEKYFTSDAVANVQGDATFVVQEVIAVDTPDTGVLKVVYADVGLDHRYRYVSWTGSTFTLPTKIGPYACTSAGSATILNDTGHDFTVLNIQVGDIIRNETDDSWAHVVAITTNQLTTTPLQGGVANIWDNADDYSLHNLVVTYDGSDLAYAPYIDAISAGASVEKVVLYASSRSVLARARKAGLKPFSTTGTLDDAGYSVAAIIPTEPQYNL